MAFFYISLYIPCIAYLKRYWGNLRIAVISMSNSSLVKTSPIWVFIIGLLITSLFVWDIHRREVLEIDARLQEDMDGIEVIIALNKQLAKQVPAMLITADIDIFIWPVETLSIRGICIIYANYPVLLRAFLFSWFGCVQQKKHIL